MKKHFALLLVGTLSGAAFAGTPTYSYLRTIDLGTTASGAWRATTAIADADGMIYLTDNTSDHIGFLDPLTANVPADVTTVYDATTPPDPFGPSSFMGIAVDGDGTIFASGCNSTVAPSTTNLLQIKKTAPLTWSNIFITGINGPNGGCDATGTGIVGFGNVLDGSVSAYLVTPLNTATQLGSQEPAGGIADTIKVIADTVNSKGYQSIVTDNLAGRVDVFSSTSPYDPNDNPLIAPSASSFTKGDQALHYQQIALNRTEQAMCVSVNRGTLGAGNTFELYDVAQLGKNLTPYQIIDGSSFTDGFTGGAPFGADIICFSSAFFSANGNNYLFIAVARSSPYVSEAYVFQQDNSAVNNWGIY